MDVFGFFKPILVALPGIEPGSRASETLVLSIVLQGLEVNKPLAMLMAC
jgi:hypothetical protein